MLSNIIVALIILAILALAIGYIYRAKKKGMHCIGCPDSAHCSGHCGGCACHATPAVQSAPQQSAVGSCACGSGDITQSNCS